MSKQTVRVIRTFHVKVEAEYGDDEQSLTEKGQQALKQDAKPDNEQALILPKGHDE